MIKYNATGVIDLAAERFTKNLWTDRNSAERPRLVSVRDEAGQARYVVECVLETCGRIGQIRVVTPAAEREARIFDQPSR